MEHRSAWPLAGDTIALDIVLPCTKSIGIFPGDNLALVIQEFDERKVRADHRHAY